MSGSDQHASAGADKTRSAFRLALAVLVVLSLTAGARAQTPQQKKNDATDVSGSGVGGTGVSPVSSELTTRSEALAQKKTSARTQFEHAEKLRTALQGKPQKERTLQEYNRAVAAYRRVYLITPHALAVPSALRTVAELYQEMGRQFDPKYHQSAIDAYQFLLHEYPTSRYRDDALFTIGQIQHEDLNQLDIAESNFQEFLRRFPRSPKVEQVKQALADIAAAREQERKAHSSRELAEQREQKRSVPRVTSIRHWNAENYTRIVIDVEDAVKYQAARISNPDRIYFDLHKAKLDPTLAGKTLEVESGFLKAMRVAQNQVGVVRLVLEVDKVKNYSAFLLPNPYRLVVDVYGQPASPAKASAPLEAPKSAKAEKPALPTGAGPAPAAEKGPEKTESASAEAPRAAAPGAGPAPPPSDAGPPPGKSGPTSHEVPKAEAAKGVPPPPVPQPTRNGQHSLTRALGLKISRIVIDPGHGGHDTGTIGPGGLMEKEICLDVALRLGKMIRERLPAAEVIYTREDDTFVPLENRTAQANQAKADMFLSIHLNSSRDHQARGIETYYLNFATSEDAMEVAARENALSQASIHELQDLLKKIANNEKVEESRELATEIQQALAKRLKRVSGQMKNRGVKKAPFVVLVGANMPSVLAEVSFLSNPADEKMLRKAEHRQRVAEGLFRGVQGYLQSLNSLTFNQPKSIVASR